MLPAIGTQERVDAMQRGRKPKAEVLNLSEVYDFLFGPPDAVREPKIADVFLPIVPADWSKLPALKLRITPADFAYDYFIMGLPLVSARLRTVLALEPDRVRYLDVDCFECSAAVQAMDYKVLHVLTYANPLNRELTGPCRFIDVKTPAGPTFAWVRPPINPNDPPPRIAWRADFAAPAPLFQVPNSAWTLATDELAERVMRAGFSDVAFYEHTKDGTQAALITRELI